MKFDSMKKLAVVAALNLMAVHAQAKSTKVYDLTCGLQLGSGAAQAVKAVRIASQPVTVRGETDFGSYVVTARRHHVYATVTEKTGGLSNQFIGEIEIHGGDGLEHGLPHEHEPSGFMVTVTPAMTGAESVVLSCSGKKVANDADAEEASLEAEF